MLQNGYSSLYHPRKTPVGILGPDEGVSLHFRTAKFQQRASAAVTFSKHYAAAGMEQQCGQSHGVAVNGSGSQNGFSAALQNRNEGCVMALLQHIPSMRHLLVCSTHLFWNPNYPDVKVAQAAVLCSSIATFLQGQGLEASRTPVVIGGDFNSLWQKYRSDPWDVVGSQPLQSGVYELLQRGQLPPSHQDHPASREQQRLHKATQQQLQQQVQQQQTLQWQQQQQAAQAIAALAAGKHAEQAAELQVAALQTSVSVLDSAGTGHTNTASSGEGGNSVASSRGNGSSRSTPSASMQTSALKQHTFTTSGLDLDSSHFMAHDREPALTTRTTTFQGTLDYIWLSKQHWRVAATLAMPYQDPSAPASGSISSVAQAEPVSNFSPCPNEHQPSDHLAVGCDAVLL
eukprot:GHRR01009996.1.p2 GENE.GHRR01009996.1~~GHRR01009996.1.p2  ORF type:complete len:401 (+),score=178.63 GHRR01009996.1:721-1923(+)